MIMYLYTQKLVLAAGKNRVNFFHPMILVIQILTVIVVVSGAQYLLALRVIGQIKCIRLKLHLANTLIHQRVAAGVQPSRYTLST